MASASVQGAQLPLSNTESASHTPLYQPNCVISTLNYYNDKDGLLPAPIIIGKPETYKQPTNEQLVTVKDIRGSEHDFTLDLVGFQYVKHESQEKEFKDEEQVKSVYYEETERLLKKITGASKVLIFAHTIRGGSCIASDQSQAKKSSGSSLTTSCTNSPRGPCRRVHIDQSYNAGPVFVKLHHPTEASRLLKSQYQIINVWRPIKTILRDPLAVTDARSVSDDDLIPVKLVYPDREGENFAVRASGEHKWYYLHEQKPQEVLLFKCFDSKMDGRARRVPHTAFVDERYEGETSRESIEVRALVFHEDDVE